MRVDLARSSIRSRLPNRCHNFLPVCLPLSWASTTDAEPSFLSSTSHLLCST